MLWLLSVDFFKINFLKKLLLGTPSECQTVWTHFVGPDLDPICLQRLSADGKTVQSMPLP